MKFLGFLAIFLFALTVQAQIFERDFSLAENASVKITNLHGRVNVIAEIAGKTIDEGEEKSESKKAFLNVQGGSETNVKIVADVKRLEISVEPANAKSRVDLTLKVPARLKVQIETADGEARLEGDFESAEIKTATGTIVANIPLDDVNYNFIWTESRPRFLSDAALEEVKEKSAGKFVLNGKLGKEQRSKKAKVKSQNGDENEPIEEQKPTDGEPLTTDENQKPKTKNQKPKTKYDKTKFHYRARHRFTKRQPERSAVGFARTSADRSGEGDYSQRRFVID